MYFIYIYIYNTYISFLSTLYCYKNMLLKIYMNITALLPCYRLLSINANYL